MHGRKKSTCKECKLSTKSNVQSMLTSASSSTDHPIQVELPHDISLQIDDIELFPIPSVHGLVEITPSDTSRQVAVPVECEDSTGNVISLRGFINRQSSLMKPMEDSTGNVIHDAAHVLLSVRSMSEGRLDEKKRKREEE